MVHKFLLEEDPFGAKIIDSGQTRFRLWAPQQEKLMNDGVMESAPRLILPDTETVFPMIPCGDGWFEAFTDHAPHKTRYAHEIWIPYGDTPGWKQVPGQMSYWQEENVYGFSRVLDPEKLPRAQKPWDGIAHEDLVLLQVHLQTLTEEGTLHAAIEKLPIARENGYTAIQLMPLEENDASRNWGYDGVLKTALQQEYGTPEDLAAFIAAAHDAGLAVFTDNVYNHWGPKGNYLEEYAPEFWHYADTAKAALTAPAEREIDADYKSPWGTGVNLDLPETRKYIEQIEWYYHIIHKTDGVRRDAVHALRDTAHEKDASIPHLLTVLTRRAEERADKIGTPFHVINEDQNDRSTLYEYRQGQSGNMIIGHMQWADNVHHVLYAALTKDWMPNSEDLANILSADDSYYKPYVFADSVDLLAEVLSTGNAYSLDTARNKYVTDEDRKKKPDLRTKIFFSTNHDQIGNTPKGLRLEELLKGDPYLPQKLDLRDAVVMLSPAVPQFYMGQSWRSESRFPFFAKWHDDSLNEAVKKGREEELRQFKDFVDPSDDKTFKSAKLDWDRATSNYKALEQFRALGKARRDYIAPHLPSGIERTEKERFGETGLRLTHHFGDGAAFSLLTNWGPAPAEYGMYRLPAWGVLYSDTLDYAPRPDHQPFLA